MLIGDFFMYAAGRGVLSQEQTANYGGSYGGVSYPIGNSADVFFYQNTIPTNTAMNSFNTSSRSSDALLSWTATTMTNDQVSTLNFTKGATLGTIINTGTIGWFCIGNQTGHTTETSRALLFGTVGLSGSGADLILPKVTVATGDLWLCNFSVQLNEVLTQI